MLKNLTFLILIVTFLGNVQCQENHPEIRSIEMGVNNPRIKTTEDVTEGAEQFREYIDYLKGNSVAVVANHSSYVGDNHLVDVLLEKGISIQKIFSPEHGFRGKASAGELVDNEKDRATGLRIVSLYGDNKKPKLKDLIDVDMVVYDIQDVGVRFYTYISTLFYVMEACAESDIPLVVLDRPNPNGFYIDGPVLEKEFQSFVGIAQIPLVHGLTVGEFAKMVNGEGWLHDGLQCELKVIPCGNYSHRDLYQLPIPPSPNLPNMDAVYLYPSLALFEGTVVSVGRGTESPFTIFGHPDFKNKTQFSFTPEKMESAIYPKLEGETCYGYNVARAAQEITNDPGIRLDWIMKGFNDVMDRNAYFLENNYIDLLIGNGKFKEQIKSGMSEEDIKATWKKDLEEYKTIRKMYLMYP